MNLIRKISILITLASLVSLIGFAQDPTNQTDASGLKQGVWKKNHQNGRLRYEGQFKDDKPVGLFQYYYDNGKLSATNNHLIDGVSVAHHSYHINGKIKGKGVFVKEKKDSLWQFFNDEEILVLEEVYSMDVLNGMSKSYYPKSGQPLEELHFNQGIKNGKWLKFFENGKPWIEADYQKGELHGEFNSYQENGKPILQGNYQEAVRHGRWLVFNMNGSVKTQDTYHQGTKTKSIKQNGTFKEFYPDEKPKSEYTYKRGEEQGDFKEWYDNGEWIKKEVPPEMEFQEEPETVEELHGQTLKKKGHYAAGKLNGKVTHYNEDGSVDRVEMYEMGELTSTIEWDETNGK
ncbi:MAG: antitoxin component YwqK of YwqJK toxin-antitoxin module [Bacteroidia bacterium]|jgi:antitoxin component YwqK of YwqJK toxin-antitoxin module